MLVKAVCTLIVLFIHLDSHNCKTLSLKSSKTLLTADELDNKNFNNLGYPEGRYTDLKDPRKEVTPVVAILTQPPSRAYNCFRKTNANCDVFNSNTSVGGIIGVADFPKDGPEDGKIASGGNLLYSILDQHGPSRWHPSYFKINLHNETHFVSEITWSINDKTAIIDNINVFLSNSNYADSQSVSRSVLNLVCSHQDKSNARSDGYNVQVTCYIQAEFIEDLFYRAKGLGVLVSTLKIVGQNYAFYQVADISLHKEFKGISPFHGYVSNPPSRAKLCQMRMNRDCGLIIYEPQSVEGFKGFPNGRWSPPDGTIASGNNPNFSPLDEYGKNRWVTVEFPKTDCFNDTHVYFNLTWYFTAGHSSDSIQIYVSNENYKTTEPLSRNHLDLEPVCTIKFYGNFPPDQLTIMCPISLEKYRQLYKFRHLLLLSVWNINDTAYAFYQVTDLRWISYVTHQETLNKCSH